jgi:hypothetical protein
VGKHASSTGIAPPSGNSDLLAVEGPTLQPRRLAAVLASLWHSEGFKTTILIRENRKPPDTKIYISARIRVLWAELVEYLSPRDRSRPTSLQRAVQRCFSGAFGVPAGVRYHPKSPSSPGRPAWNPVPSWCNDAEGPRALLTNLNEVDAPEGESGQSGRVKSPDFVASTQACLRLINGSIS